MLAAANDAPGSGASQRTVVCHLDSAHEDGTDAVWRSARIGIRADVRNARRVEEHHVRERAAAELTAVLEVELAGWQSRHLVDRGRQVEHVLVTHVVPQHARKAIPQAWVRLATNRWHTIRADHRRRVRHHSLHVGLVHGERHDKQRFALLVE